MNASKLNKENEKQLERIQKIRKDIHKFEYIINDIVNILNSKNYLDQSSLKILVSNVKDYYYNTVMAWEKLDFAVREKNHNLEDSKNYLYLAKSRLSQSNSELKVLKNKKLPEMILIAEDIFNTCWNAFFNEFKILDAKKKIIKPFQKILELSETMYQLPCSICGKIAVEFKIGFGRFDKEESLVFTGITHSRSFKKDLSIILFKILKTNNLYGVHEFMKQYHGYEGLDAYCPECDKIYCWEHYNATEEWEEGFYDCTYGTCPEGHKRMIDD